MHVMRDSVRALVPADLSFSFLLPVGRERCQHVISHEPCPIPAVYLSGADHMKRQQAPERKAWIRTGICREMGQAQRLSYLWRA